MGTRLNITEAVFNENPQSMYDKDQKKTHKKQVAQRATIAHLRASM